MEKKKAVKKEVKALKATSLFPRKRTKKEEEESEMRWTREQALRFALDLSEQHAKYGQLSCAKVVLGDAEVFFDFMTKGIK